MMQSKNTQQPNDKKMRELILYIALLSESDKSFGATKLNKLLFLADFLAYQLLGDAITGQEYQAIEWGPVPRRLVPLREEMEAEQDIIVRKISYYGYSQDKIVALREPDLNEFTSQEVNLVNRIVEHWWGVSGSKMSEQSHEFVGWELAEPGETIPYSTALIGFRNLTKDEIEYGKTLEPLAREYLS